MSSSNFYLYSLIDLVAAHKCLLKEKEVLEASIQAISKSTSSRSCDDNASDKSQEETSNSDVVRM